GATGATIETWQLGYGNLPAVAFSAPTTTKFQMALTADANFNVTLSSFDMAGYGGSHTIASLSVLDNTGKTLFSKSNVVIAGGTTHTHFSFSTPLRGQGLSIRFDSTNATGGG